MSGMDKFMNILFSDSLISPTKFSLVNTYSPSLFPSSF